LGSLDGARDDRLVRVDAAEQNRCLGRVEGIAGAGLLEAHGHHDAARRGALDALAAVGVHREEACHLLVAPGARVLYLVAGLEHAGVEAQENRLAPFVHGHLEREGAEGGRVIGRSRGGLSGRRVHAGDGGDFGRRGQEIADRVQQGLDALVAQGRAREHGHDGAGHGALAQGRAERRRRDGLAFEVGGRDLVVEIGGGLDELLARRRHRLGQGRRHVVLARRIVFDAREVDGALAHEIDHALELVLRADGQLHRHGMRAQPGADLVDDGAEVGAGPVHLVDEGQAGHAEVVSLVPHRLGLRLHAGDATEDHDRAVEHAQGALDFHGEIHVAWGIDEVQVVPAPGQRGGRGSDGDAALALLRHPVHLRLAVVDLADLVDAPGVVEEALGHCGLAGVDVGDDADVAHAGELRRLLRLGVRTWAWFGHGRRDYRERIVTCKHDGSSGIVRGR
jgi:hypothetical protein